MIERSMSIQKPKPDFEISNLIDNGYLHIGTSQPPKCYTQEQLFEEGIDGKKYKEGFELEKDFSRIYKNKGRSEKPKWDTFFVKKDDLKNISRELKIPEQDILESSEDFILRVLKAVKTNTLRTGSVDLTGIPFEHFIDEDVISIGKDDEDMSPKAFSVPDWYTELYVSQVQESVKDEKNDFKTLTEEIGQNRANEILLQEKPQLNKTGALVLLVGLLKNADGKKPIDKVRVENIKHALTKLPTDYLCAFYAGAVKGNVKGSVLKHIKEALVDQSKDNEYARKKINTFLKDVLKVEEIQFPKTEEEKLQKEITIALATDFLTGLSKKPKQEKK